MAEAWSELAAIIHRYRQELEAIGIRCDRILLYGSRATGLAREGSDIDLSVVSPDWNAYSERERLEMLGVAAARIFEPIQARGVTPEEIASHQLAPFWEQVLEGRAVVVNWRPLSYGPPEKTDVPGDALPVAEESSNDGENCCPDNGRGNGRVPGNRPPARGRAAPGASPAN